MFSPAIILFLRLLAPATDLSAAIAPLRDAKHLSEAERFEYAFYIVAAAERTKLDPYLITAVMWHESRFQKGTKSRTKDYGLMQVHWQKLNPKVGETWLIGMTPAALMDPLTNINAGATQLAHKKRYCGRKGHDQEDHPWWAHYKWGTVVKSPSYGAAVEKKYKALLRNRGKIKKPHRSRGPRPTS